MCLESDEGDVNYDVHLTNAVELNMDLLEMLEDCCCKRNLVGDVPMAKIECAGYLISLFFCFHTHYDFTISTANIFSFSHIF